MKKNFVFAGLFLVFLVIIGVVVASVNKNQTKDKLVSKITQENVVNYSVGGFSPAKITLERSGVWGYHNHAKPLDTGTVEVVE